MSAASIVDMPSRSEIEKSLAPMRARTAAISSRISRADSGCLASSQKNHVSVYADVSCPAKRSVLQGVSTEIDRICLPNSPNLINDLVVRKLAFRVLGIVGTQKDAHDIAAIAPHDTFTNYVPCNFTNIPQVAPKTAILAARKVNEKIEDWFWKISPKIFEQYVKRPMVQRVDAGGYV